MCGGFNASSQQLYVTTAQMAQGESQVSLSVEPAETVKIIAYFIPRALPGSKNSNISEWKPFETQVTVTNYSMQLHNQEHTINAWGGSTINLDLKTKI